VNLPLETPQRVLGRYVLYGEIASGGMATVHVGRLMGPVGFSRTVAVKRLHPQLAKEPEFVAMFLDEAHLAARVQHANVVQTLDVVAEQGELFLVMEYVQGESLSRLLRGIRAYELQISPAIACAIASNVLHGLHAAHEARNERGEPLNIVHRDVSPQNVLVGSDGIARVLDFGVAKAAGRLQTTREGQLKGKLSYMAPEQLRDRVVDRRTDIYAAAVVLWETLTGQRLFQSDNEGAILAKILSDAVPPPSQVSSRVPPEVDAVVLRGLDRNPAARYATARDMALDLERAVRVASPAEVGEWVQTIAGDALTKRAVRVKEIESSSQDGHRLVDQLRALASPERFPSNPSQPAVSAENASEPSRSHVPVVSIASTEPAARAKTRARLGIVVAFAVLVSALFAVTGVLVVTLKKNDASSGAPAEPSASVAAGGDLGSPPPTEQPPPPPTTEPAPMSSSAASGSGAGPAPSPVATKKNRAPAGAPAATKRARPAGTCDPPYTFDENGKKKYKVNCF
jgi:eukaryotic-like serine/threonine-protein kinase